MSPPNPLSEIPPPVASPPLGSLLEKYVRGDQEAFAGLVRRTTPLVMAAALRRCGGRHALAQEAAQTVFVDLARRAPSLRADATLIGWLHQRATRAAGDLMKQELRRVAREQHAASDAEVYSLDGDTTSAPWNDCREKVDEALSRLKLEERTAVLLRCAEGQDFEAVGAALNCSAEAARKKVSRALEKLRTALGRHRTGISAAVIISSLAADQTRAASGAAGAGIDTLASQLAGNALAAAGKITLFARALPWLKAAGTGTAAAAALWAWPLAARLHRPSPSVPVKAPVSEVADKMDLIGYPQVPAQLVPAAGLSLDEIVQRLAAMAESPKLPESWRHFQFYKKQIPAGQSGLALRKLRKAVSARGWHDFMKRDWAEDLIKSWAARDGPGALEFLLANLDGVDFEDAEGSLSSSLTGNLVDQSYRAACGIGYREESERNLSTQAVALVADVTARLAPSADGRWTSAQRILISRGMDLARVVFADGNVEAMGLLVDLVNFHGFKWLDLAAGDLKTKENLTGLLGHLSRLQSPARRSALQLSILERLGELDLPEALRQVEAVMDPAQRWKWACAVAAPPHWTNAQGPIVRHELKPFADWWLRQTPPGKEKECVQIVATTWLNIDPEWGAVWAEVHIGRDAILTTVRGIVKDGAKSYAVSSRSFYEGGRLKRNVEALRKLDPDGTPAFIQALLEENRSQPDVGKLRKLLRP